MKFRFDIIFSSMICFFKLLFRLWSQVNTLFFLHIVQMNECREVGERDSLGSEAEKVAVPAKSQVPRD